MSNNYGCESLSFGFSYNYGPAHIVVVSTEVYFFLSQGLELIAKQKAWLKDEFEVSNLYSTLHYEHVAMEFNWLNIIFYITH